MLAELFDTKLAALKQQQTREAQNKLSHRCVLCKKTFKNANGYAQHLNTKVIAYRTALLFPSVLTTHTFYHAPPPSPHILLCSLFALHSPIP
jgi:uncharacterized C2H2 Zn-finger protein